MKDLVILLSYSKNIYSNKMIVDRISEFLQYKKVDFSKLSPICNDIEDPELSDILRQVISKSETKEL